MSAHSTGSYARMNGKRPRKIQGKSSALHTMKRLLALSAIIEGPTGLGLMVVPPVVVRLLLGSPLDTSAARTLGRVAGAGLLALGVACWLARDDAQSQAARGLVVAMLIYNVATVAVLTYAFV